MTKSGRLAVVLLGASRFQKWPQLDNIRFLNSSRLFKDALENSCSKNFEVSILDLFNFASSPSDLVETVANFIDSTDPSDIIVHYCGHGDFTEDRKHYIVCLASTKPNVKATSALKISDFCLDLDESISNRRFYFILDACYAGAAMREFMDVGGQTLLGNSVRDIASKSGRVVLTATNDRDVALAPKDDAYTIFTGSFCSVLRLGIKSKSSMPELSWYEVFEECQRQISRKLGARAPKPQFTSQFGKHLNAVNAVSPGYSAFFANTCYENAEESELDLTSQTQTSNESVPSGRKSPVLALKQDQLRSKLQLLLSNWVQGKILGSAISVISIVVLGVFFVGMPLFEFMKERSEMKSMDIQLLCPSALRGDRRDWSYDKSQSKYVDEAHSRNLGVDDCRASMGLPSLLQLSAEEKILGEKIQKVMAAKDETSLCTWALNGSNMGWNDDSTFAIYVKEAQRRNLAVDDCKKFLGTKSN